MTIRVTVWNEYVQDAEEGSIRQIYPEGIHGAIVAGLAESLGEAVTTRVATLAEEDHGLSQHVLDDTDVLLWWGHLAHDRVDDAVVEAVCQHVLDGMGLIVLHSGQGSKVFQRLLGTSARLDWRHGDRELLWTVDPGHDIAQGVPQPVIIPEQEMYGEFFDIPVPDELVFISGFAGGEVFRSGCCFRRGRGRIFYFGPGHEEYPVFYQPEIRRIIGNAVCWATPRRGSLAETEGGIHRDAGWYETETHQSIEPRSARHERKGSTR